MEVSGVIAWDLKRWQSVFEGEGFIDGLIWEVASGVVSGFFGGIKERDDEDVKTEEGAGDAEDDEERRFHGMGLR